jgi:uncharacterized protein YprB with RNaseH-like and TPR domain
MPKKKADRMISACCFDLECSSLNADFGIVLCGVIKPDGQTPKVFRLDDLSKEWDKRRSNDYPVIKAIADELVKYDIIAAHNGAWFDLPFLRTRMMRWDMPALPKIKIIDPVQILRKHLRLSSNSLDRATNFMGINTKSSVDGEIWLKAALDGSKPAMNYIVKHCVEDVKMLEQVVAKTKGYCSSFNCWGSAF